MSEARLASEDLIALNVRGSAAATHQVVCRTFDEHFRRRLGLREVAEAVTLSPNYLSALFRKEMGTTVTRYGPKTEPAAIAGDIEALLPVGVG